MPPPFRKILIANRGEIAVRIARTCRVMGIPTVGVYSEADRRSLHVRATDEAALIGPAESRESYLDIERILDAARRTGADAIHPGYGFLSQNGDFADRTLAAGIAFIGPPGSVHREMGDKSGARKTMARAGVAVVPGYDGDAQQDAVLQGEADRIGYPLMLKPSRGGGGKGMRSVLERGSFLSALEGSRREALSAFGDDRMVLERLVTKARHVEVQVLADGKGKVLHLFERECSIQRRHQKVVEEAPCAALSEEQRRALCEAGVQAARAAGYVNAGTVEFLVDPEGRHYFLEMNTRLQVEHAVTELTTGLDLVRLQIDVASGRGLPLTQEGIARHGHALECRLYAEDPFRGDLPSSGPILYARPPEGPGVRFDSGIETGSEVTVHYDPLLAKIVTWGATRDEAIARMGAAVRETVVLGVATNAPRLLRILESDAFLRGELSTSFLDDPALNPLPVPAPDLAFAVAGACLERTVDAAVSGSSRPSVDPWTSLGPWRLS
jgi:3-methylcrotonyl-CoA carboxylase alpha subunit